MSQEICRAPTSVVKPMMFICGECGERNPRGTEFCSACNAFLAWDQLEAGPESPDATVAVHAIPQAVSGEQPAHAHASGLTNDREPASRSGRDSHGPDVGLGPVEHRLREDAGSPRISSSPDGPDGPEAGFQVPNFPTQLSVSSTGEASDLVLRVTNSSQIVEGYLAALATTPPWLSLQGEPDRLMPHTTGELRLRLRIVSQELIPAQSVEVVVRVMAQSDTARYRDLPITVQVPAVDASMTLRAEPEVIRIPDGDLATCVVRVDNSTGNSPRQLRLSAADPERAVRVEFFPDTLTVGPGERATARVALNSPAPPAGQEISRRVTITGDDGSTTTEVTVTLHQRTPVPEVDPPVTLEVTPSVVHVVDDAVARTQVSIDNRAGQDWAHVRLQARDPEGVVQVAWSEQVVQVPAGRVAHTQVQFLAPVPEPGTQTSRTVELTATDQRHRKATTQVRLEQVASPSSMSTLAISASPSLLRTNRASARLTVGVDNTHGTRAVRVRVVGSDPENSIRFSIAKSLLDVPAGHRVTTEVTVKANPPGAHQEVERTFTLAATDGVRKVTTEARLVQAGRDRLPLARAVTTAVAALVIAGSTLLPVAPGGSLRTLDLDADLLARQFSGQSLALGGLEQVLTASLVLLVLAGGVLLGLTSRTGRLTRLCALLAAVVLASVVAMFLAAGAGVVIGPGVAVGAVGCVLAYVGGRLIRR
ncbi:MAG: hypothetical protein ACK5MT_10195 [Actinomycetales bacterium]